MGDHMNYIGNKLKALRQELGLTQTEMAAGVISVSFYSKVERGLNDIGVNDFLEILQKHNVKPQKFFKSFKSEQYDQKKINTLINKFVKAANEDNDKEIKVVVQEFESIEPKTSFIKSQTLLAQMIATTHDHNALKSLTENEKRKIKKIIFQKDTDENEYLRLAIIANTIRVYSFDEASFLISNIIRRYKNVNKIDRKILSALSALMVNYTNWCIEKKQFGNCSAPLKYLRKLPATVELAFSKIIGQYYEDILNDKKNEAEKIKYMLIKAGYQTIVNKIVSGK